MLHILNKGPDSVCAANMLRVVDEQDEVVLIEQGVQASLVPQWQGFEQCQGRIHLLSEDLVSAGLVLNAQRHGLSIIEMAGFLALTERHPQSVTWY
ncbi:DsrH/TusB family sulfur relay protein [Vreelandella sp. EE22]